MHNVWGEGQREENSLKNRINLIVFTLLWQDSDKRPGLYTRIARNRLLNTENENNQ